MNYEQDIRIDDQALDIEWLEQPSKMMKYTRHAADMRRALDEAKQNLDIAKAEADKKIRKSPSEYGIEKITEAAVTNTILIEDDYMEAFERYLAAKYETDMAEGAVRAFDQRKTALENLVRLQGQSYFAGPKMPRDLTWEREEKEKKSNAGIAQKINRRTK